MNRAVSALCHALWENPPALCPTLRERGGAQQLKGCAIYSLSVLLVLPCLSKAVRKLFVYFLLRSRQSPTPSRGTAVGSHCSPVGFQLFFSQLGTALCFKDYLKYS